MKKAFNFIRFLSIFLILTLGLIPFGMASADGETVISISGPDTIDPGEQFTIDISVEPGTAIAGVQFNLAFDASLVNVDSVAEGNLLSQGGASTYFTSGTIDNVAGTVTAVAGAITTPGQSVSAPATFATVTLTASTPGGTSPLTLSNVVVGDINGQPVPVNVVSGQVTVNQTSDGEEDGGSGGGGGGGGGGAVGGATNLFDVMTQDGRLVSDVTATSGDQRLKIIIPQGTVVKNKLGQNVNIIRINPVDEQLSPSLDSRVISLFYEIQPSGTTFDPDATLVYEYREGEIPEGTSENSLYIALWDPVAGEWIVLEGTIDPEANTVSVTIQHLSIYALMAHTRPASFEFSDLTSSSPEARPGESITFSVLVTNTGDYVGSYGVSLKVDDGVVETKTVTLDGGESKAVYFDIISTAAGEHKAGVADLSAIFVVREAQAPAAFVTSDLAVSPSEITSGQAPLPGFTGESANPGVGISGFTATPVYDPKTGILVSTRIEYQLDGLQEQSAETSLLLKTFYEGEPLEEIPLLSPARLQSDRYSGSLSYMPSAGWKAGLYSFQAELYEGENFVQSSEPQQFTVTPQAVTAVVSLKLLGIIIGATLIVAAVIVAMVVAHRRDMLRSNYNIK